MARTILLADDSPTIRKIVELTFSDTEFLVETAENGAEALAKLDSARPDLVLADVVMPEPTGYDICRAVKGSARPVPVLLLAGTFEPFDPEQARECGADGHLVKPFESRTLRDRVKRLLSPEPTAEGVPQVVESPPSAELEQVVQELAVEPVAEEEPAPVEKVPVAVEEGASDTVTPAGEIAPELVDAVAREVVKRLSEEVLREIAWEVVPDLASKIIRERLRELEGDDLGEG
jgi:DNA-binding response OmpR family regulator